MAPISAILWPTDASKAALHALDTAIELAEQFQAKLHVLQVVSPVPVLPETGFAAGMVPGFDVSLYEKELLKTTREALKQTIGEKVPKTIDVEVHVDIGWPADAIIDFARRNDISMIVMATHGRTGMAHLMLGSVTEKTIRRSSVPVLIIPGGGGDK
jgi:universal stress protein A